MEPTLALLILLYGEIARAWTHSETVSQTIITAGFGSPTSTYVRVSPTGEINSVSTSVNVTQVAVFALDAEYGAMNVTLTSFIVSEGAPVVTCGFQPFFSESYCGSVTPTSATSTPSSSIETSFYVPYTVTNLASCTLTSFSYVTSGYGSLSYFGNDGINPGNTYSDLTIQAAQTGSAGEALFVTTYISTVSVDLGDQAITITHCDIWLKTDALWSLSPLGGEHTYLTECVDPRRYACTTSNLDVAASGSCGTDWVGQYAATATAPSPTFTDTSSAQSTATSGGSGNGAGGGGASSTSSSHSEGGAGKEALRRLGLTLAGLLLPIILLVLLM